MGENVCMKPSHFLFFERVSRCKVCLAVKPLGLLPRNFVLCLLSFSEEELFYPGGRLVLTVRTNNFGRNTHETSQMAD